MNKRNIIITGGAGFIGSHVVRLFVNKYPDYHIISLDKLTYAGNLANLKDVENKPNYTFVKADICDFEMMLKIFKQYHIDGVIHLAAESHVDRSIREPFTFARTNVLGTLSLLQAARLTWGHDGGGIFVDTHAEVILESGSITGNDAWNGGGVYVNGGGSFTMNGGEISNNRTLRPYHGGGGGIYVLNDETKGTGKFVMNGGVIKGNTTLTQGGGAFIDGEMEMNGGKIIDNTGLKGGGVCINGTMTLNDGVVSRNKAEFLEETQYDAIELPPLSGAGAQALRRAHPPLRK